MNKFKFNLENLLFHVDQDLLVWVIKALKHSCNVLKTMKHSLGNFSTCINCAYLLLDDKPGMSEKNRSVCNAMWKMPIYKLISILRFYCQ